MTDRPNLDPDPLVPADVDRAYAMGFEDGWISTKPRPSWRPRLAGLVIAALSGAIVGALITAAVVHAAPRPALTTTPRNDRAELGDRQPLGLSPTAAALSDPASTSSGPTGAPLERQVSGAPLTASRGIASWYDDGPGLYGAVPGWHFGDRTYRLRVCSSSRCVDVTVRDFCGCPGGRIIDLSPAAFRRLAPLSAGLVRVTVSRLGDVPAPTPPATDVGP